MRPTSSARQWLPIATALLLVFGAVLVVRGRSRDGAAKTARLFESHGIATEAWVQPLKVVAGSPASISASVESSSSTSGIVDIEVFGDQHHLAYQRFFEDQHLRAGQLQNYSFVWDVPPTAPASRYRVKVGVFQPGWAKLEHWNDDAAAFAVVSSSRPIQSAQNSPAPSANQAPQTAPSLLLGANVPWYNWACDFGCGSHGGVSDPSVQSTLGTAFGQARGSGMQVMRWWMFEGDAHQITRDARGAPVGLDPAVYADIDAALQIAQANDVYYDFVLFSSPTAIPSAWLTDPVQRVQLASVLAPLFAHYQNNPRVWSWEVFNEPEWDIWNKKIDQTPVQATVKAIADAVHANSSAKVSVGSAMLDGLSMWVGQGLDYYQAHWYDSMSSGNWCVICTDYNTVRDRYHLDAPLVIGEFHAAADAKPLQRYTYFTSHGFAGAWPWSLFPDHTNDHMAIDLSAAQAFASGQVDTSSPIADTTVVGSTTANPMTFRSTASAAATVTSGTTEAIQISAGSDTATHALLDVEIYGPDGAKAFQQFWDNESFAAGQSKAFVASWQVSGSAPPGRYVIKIGLFSPGWGTLYAWNDNAAAVQVTAAGH